MTSRFPIIAGFATALMFAAAPIEQAEAAKIKIQVKAAKVKPNVPVKIQAAKPKVRVKVKAAKAVEVKVKLKPTPKPKIKVKAIKAPVLAKVKPAVKVPIKVEVPKPKTPKKIAIRTDVKVRTAKIAPAPKVQTAKTVKPNDNANRLNAAQVAKIKNAKMTLTAKVDGKPKKLPLATIAVPAKRPAAKFQAHKPSISPLGSGKQSDFEHRIPSPAVIQAAEAAKQLVDIAGVNALRDTATANLPHPSNGLDRETPKGNRDILDSMWSDAAKGPATGSMTPGSNWTNDGLRGVGPETFAGLPNTHGQAPANAGNGALAAQDYWSSHMAGQIAGAKGGVASQGPVRTVHYAQDFPRHPMPGYQTNSYTDYYANGSKVVHHDVTYPNGTQSTSAMAYDRDGNPMWRMYNPSPTSSERPQFEEFDAPNRVQMDEVHLGSGYKPPKPDETDGKAGTNPTKLYDPDYAGGGNTPFPWINEREKPTFDFSTAGNGKTPGPLTQGPGETAGGIPMVGTAYTANDVLERYDPDNQYRGGERFRFENACFHSEC